MILAKFYQKFIPKWEIWVCQAQRTFFFLTHCLLWICALKYSPNCMIPIKKKKKNFQLLRGHILLRHHPMHASAQLVLTRHQIIKKKKCQRRIYSPGRKWKTISTNLLTISTSCWNCTWRYGGGKRGMVNPLSERGGTEQVKHGPLFWVAPVASPDSDTFEVPESVGSSASLVLASSEPFSAFPPEVGWIVLGFSSLTVLNTDSVLTWSDLSDEVVWSSSWFCILLSLDDATPLLSSVVSSAQVLISSVALEFWAASVTPIGVLSMPRCLQSTGHNPSIHGSTTTSNLQY